MRYKLFFRSILFLIGLFPFFSSAQRLENNTLNGLWKGFCEADSSELSFSIRFEKKESGYKASYNSDGQRAMDIPLQKLSYDSANKKISFALIGDRDSWLFEGIISGNKLNGTVTKGDRGAKFFLTKEPSQELPYSKQEVTFINDTVRLAGSLYLPKTTKKVPALLFLHGSGSESRFASAYFADFFARRGIAILIYDKRGVGNSTGRWNISSFQDLANDAIAGVKLLQSNPNIDASKIGIYGHSQGGSICPMLLTMYPDISFGISAASAGVSMEESDWYEVQNRFRRYVSGSDYDNAMKIMKKYLHFASTGIGYTELNAEAKEFEKEQWFQNYIGGIDTTASFFTYYRKIGQYNCVDYWKLVKQPVLILKGEKDQTSPGYPTFQNIENALKQAGNSKYKIIMLPNSTHEMHLAGRPSDFWFKATPGYCDMIYDWLLKTINNK